ncbi:hypothetical protein LPJ61_005523 [Coemansia biformis]|uniref:Uncharacterized protein n=1 Tax=Coemansia biformis TaxID=1286918 RepID=A0A9W7Y859_9FUNG|nr:hypothetical protein LPJ61_005523 [Coemansia biformis]
MYKLKAKRAVVARDIGGLKELVDKHGDDWVQIGREMGTVPNIVKGVWLSHQQSAKSAGACHDGAATSPDGIEVQQQLSQGHRVDWAQVSQVVGLDVLKCLEICQVDTGKARWTYDPDTFSWEMADRMKAFLADNYPAPATPNYRTVSNYLWIDRDDCIHMSDLLKGNIAWTDEVKARLIDMRRKGMLYKDIGKQLSPNLPTPKVANVYHRLQRSVAFRELN